MIPKTNIPIKNVQEIVREKEDHPHFVVVQKENVDHLHFVEVQKENVDQEPHRQEKELVIMINEEFYLITKVTHQFPHHPEVDIVLVLL